MLTSLTKQDMPSMKAKKNQYVIYLGTFTLKSGVIGNISYGLRTTTAYSTVSSTMDTIAPLKTASMKPIQPKIVTICQLIESNVVLTHVFFLFFHGSVLF